MSVIRTVSTVTAATGLILGAAGTTAIVLSPALTTANARTQAEPAAPVATPTPTQQLDLTYDPTRSFAPLVDQASKAVASIKVESDIDPAALEMLRRFRGFGGMDPSAVPPKSGEGSGFVISADGLLLTNHHVIDDADRITVVFSDGTEVDADVVGSDASMDIALLQLPEDRSWEHLELGDSDEARVGDWVLAMGNPLGLGHTVTAGIISGKGRVLGHDIFGNEDFLQTDAAINPGNSGGPLVTLDGKVVGMNTAIIAGANTVGFAVPTKLITGVVDELKAHGHIARGFLGVNSQPLTPELAEALGVDAEDGAVVASVFPDTPAADAGLLRGDVVVQVDGEDIDDQVGLVAAIGNKRPGDTVKLTVVRPKGPKSLEVTLAERPGEDRRSTKAPGTTLDALGLTLGPLPSSVAAQQGIEEGVLVRRVDRDGPASGRLRPGDVILQVNHREVDGPEEVAKILARSSGTAFFVVARDGSEVFVTLPLP